MSSPTPSDRLLVLPMLLLVASVAWQWVEAGGAPSMGGSPWGGIGFTIMVLAGPLLVIGRTTGTRAVLRVAGYVLGVAGFLLYFGVSVGSVVRGRRSPWMILPIVLLLAFWAWLWRQVRRPPAPHD